LDFRLSNRLTGGTRTILTDRFKLESIIENLLKNAIKFTHKGYIEFGCHNESGEIVFYVKDTGTGIRKERLNSVFDRFVQADLSNTRPHEGSGLGLSIVKAYTEMLGGRVAVESKQDSGSTFFVYLPVKQF
jgi:signal transduction histidine kinase